MRAGQVIQFVYFETLLDTAQFIEEWERFTRSVDINPGVTLQQSEKKGSFRYLAQHRCAAGDFEFIFARTRRPKNQTTSAPIKTEHLGGYSVLRPERKNDVDPGESKVFAFLDKLRIDLDAYKQLCPQSDLNIYQAYYESCKYVYILEFFVNNELAANLVRQLKLNNVSEAGIYKECVSEIT